MANTTAKTDVPTDLYSQYYPALDAAQRCASAKIKMEHDTSQHAPNINSDPAPPEHHQAVQAPIQQTWIGQQPNDTKSANTLRLLFQNVNSLGPQYAQQMSILANEPLTLDVDILAITEHCVNIHHRDTHKRLHNSLRTSIQEKTVLQIDSSTTMTTNSYLPGGTAILMTGDAVGRLEPNGKGGDKMGRWSFIHLRRQNLPPLTIYSVQTSCFHVMVPGSQAKCRDPTKGLPKRPVYQLSDTQEAR